MTGGLVLAGIWILIILVNFLIYIRIKHKKNMSYASIDIEVGGFGKPNKTYKNVKEYMVNNFGYITFIDEDKILHTNVSSWKVIGYKETLEDKE